MVMKLMDARLWWPPMPTLVLANALFGIITGTNMTANGHKTALVGELFMQGRASGAKTLSAAGGGGIYWNTSGTTTFTAGSTLRVGLQNLDTSVFPGVPDGAYDTYADLVGGTDTLTSGVWNWTPMESGSISLSHNDLICVVFEFTAFNTGDLVAIAGLLNSGAQNMPMQKTYTTSWQTPAAGLPTVMFKFDDGTLARFSGGLGLRCRGAGETFTSSTNPDERGIAFSVPWRCYIDSVIESYIVNAANLDRTLTIIQDPLGSPSVLATITKNAEGTSSLSGGRVIPTPLATPLELRPNVVYGITTTATSAGQVQPQILEFGDPSSANEKLLNGFPANYCKITRNDGTGAYSAESPAATIYPIFIGICGIDDGIPAPSLGLGGMA